MAHGKRGTRLPPPLPQQSVTPMTKLRKAVQEPLQKKVVMQGNLLQRTIRRRAGETKTTIPHQADDN